MRNIEELPSSFNRAEIVDPVRVYIVDSSINGIGRITAPAIGITEPGRGIEVVNMALEDFRGGNLPDLYGGSLRYIVTYPYGKHTGDMFEPAIVSSADSFVKHVYDVDHAQPPLHGLQPVASFSPRHVLDAIDRVEDYEPRPVSRGRFNRQSMVGIVDASGKQLVVGGADRDAFTIYQFRVPRQAPTR